MKSTPQRSPLQGEMSVHAAAGCAKTSGSRENETLCLRFPAQLGHVTAQMTTQSMEKCQTHYVVCALPA